MRFRASTGSTPGRWRAAQLRCHRLHRRANRGFAALESSFTGLDRSVAGGEYLTRDHRPVLLERGGQLGAGRAPRQQDPVADVESVALAGVLDEADHLAGESFALQL